MTIPGPSASAIAMCRRSIETHSWSFALASKLWLLGGPLLVLRLTASGASPGIATGLVLYLLGAIAIARPQRSLGAFSPASALLYRVFVVLFCLVSGLALLDRLVGADVTWKGRRLVSRRRGSSHR